MIDLDEPSKGIPGLVELAIIIAHQIGDYTLKVRADAEKARADAESAGTKSSLTDTVTPDDPRFDPKLESWVRRLVRKVAPDDGILGEIYRPTLGSGVVTWVIDPIDSKVNYCSGSAYGVSVVVVVRDPETWVCVPVACCVYDPVTGRTLYAGADGYGAYFQATRLELGLSNEPQERDGQAQMLRWDCPYMREIRLKRPAALDLCAVARGELGLHHDINPWVLAAEALIVAQAGGKIPLGPGGRFAPPWPNGAQSAGRHANISQADMFLTQR